MVSVNSDIKNSLLSFKPNYIAAGEEPLSEMEEIQSMMKEKYESLSAAELKAVAKARGLKHLSGLKKSEVVARMLEADEEEKAERKRKQKIRKR